MGFIMAGKTKTKTTTAFYGSAVQHIGGYGITTTGSGTPGNMSIILNEGFSDKTNVFLIDFFIDEFLDNLVGNCVFTV